MNKEEWVKWILDLKAHPPEGDKDILIPKSVIEGFKETVERVIADVAGGDDNSNPYISLVNSYTENMSTLTKDDKMSSMVEAMFMETLERLKIFSWWDTLSDMDKYAIGGLLFSKIITEGVEKARAAAADSSDEESKAKIANVIMKAMAERHPELVKGLMSNVGVINIRLDENGDPLPEDVINGVEHVARSLTQGIKQSKDLFDIPTLSRSPSKKYDN